MKEKLVLFAAVLLCIVMNAGIIHSQPKIRIKLIQPPPDNLEANHLWKAEITNLMKDDLTIYLEGTAEESKDGMIVTGTTKQFVIKPGTRTYYYRDFEGGSVSWKNNKYKEILLRTGKAPSGTYSICMTAKLPDGSIAGMENCITQIVNDKADQEIVLIQPENGSELNPEEPIVFTWRAPIGAREPCCPFIKIVEIIGNQSPEAAIKNNPAFYSNDNLRTSSFSYPVSAPKFVEGKNYAWQITFNDIKSEVRKFKWKERIEKITDITEKADTTKNSWIRTSEMGFIENKGQFSRTASGEKVLPEHAPLLKASFRNCDFYLTPRGLSYLFFQAKENEKKSHHDEDEITRGNNDDSVVFQYYRTDFNFSGISIKKENLVFEMPDNQGVMNYYYESCPDGVLDVQAYRKVTVKDVYKNVDLVLIGNDTSGMKYDFILKPGSNPDDIKFEIKGAENTALSENSTKLEVKTPISSLIEGPLKVYYQDNKIKIKAEYKEESKGIYKLKLENLDKNQTIVIDPPVLWSTYYGAGGNDGPKSIKTDNLGNIFITGYCNYRQIPTWDPNNGAYYSNHFFNGYDFDAFIIKFNSNYQRVWATIIGSDKYDHGYDICFRTNNDILLTGYTESAAFPIPPQVAGKYYSPYKGGSNDIFIIKFDNTGHMKWGTFYGGRFDDQAYSIKINTNDAFFISGLTNSDNISTFQSAGNSFVHGKYSGKDVLLFGFDNNDNLIWSTYWGGNCEETGEPRLTLDASGNIFVGGNTCSSDLPLAGISPQYQQTFINSSGNLFAVKFSPNMELLWSTYIDGNNFDEFSNLTTDLNNNLIITGRTFSTNFPVLNCTSGQTFLGNGDIFLMKFSNQGHLILSRYFGGSYMDFVYGIITDINSDIYITGKTRSNNFETINSADGYYFDNSLGGNEDAYISKFSTNGNLLWSTYIGSQNGYNEFGIALDRNTSNEIFLTGELGDQITDPSFLVNPGNDAYFQNWASRDDIFIIKLGAANPPPVQTSNCDTLFRCDYSNPDIWTHIKKSSDGTGSVPSDADWGAAQLESHPTPNFLVRVEDGVCKFDHAIDGGCDYRVSTPLGVTLDNSWQADFEFNYSELGVQNRVGQSIFALTNGGDNNPVNDSKNKTKFYCYYSDIDAIMVWMWYPTNQYYDNKGQTRPPAEGRTFGLVPWVKDGKGNPNFTNWNGSISNFNSWTPPTEIIAINSNQTYYCRLERLNATRCRLSVFDDNNRTHHVPNSPQCFDIPEQISGLNTLQHSTTPYGNYTRELTATIDNTIIYNISDVTNNTDCHVQTTCGSSNPVQTGCTGCNRVVGTNISLCTGQSGNLNAYMGSYINNINAQYNNDGSLIPLNNYTFNPVNGKNYMIETGGGHSTPWGMEFDAAYQIDIQGTLSNLTPCQGNAQFELSGNGFGITRRPDFPSGYNQFHNYYYEFTSNGSQIQCSNINHANANGIIVYDLYELCDISNYNFTWELLPESPPGITINNNTSRTPTVQSNTAGSYRIKVSARCNSNNQIIAQDTVNVWVTEQCLECPSCGCGFYNPVIITDSLGTQIGLPLRNNESIVIGTRTVTITPDYVTTGSGCTPRFVYYLYDQNNIIVGPNPHYYFPSIILNLNNYTGNTFRLDIHPDLSSSPLITCPPINIFLRKL